VVYHNSIDAFQQLLSPTVSQISAKTGCMQNGIAYCVVQVLFVNGDEYRIEAYDEEAGELYRVAKEQSAHLCLHASA
jgi:hypothetical protein